MNKLNLNLTFGDLFLLFLFVNGRGKGDDVVEEKHPCALDRIEASEERAVQDQVTMRRHEALQEE